MATNKGFSRVFLTLMTCMAVLFIAPFASAQGRKLLRKPTAAPANVQPTGHLPASQRLNLALTLPLRNVGDLQSLLQQLNDPTSPQHRKFLTVQQFTEQFGPTPQDYQSVITFATAHGLTVTRTFPNRLLVNVSGPVSNIEQAFHVTMQTYLHLIENRVFYAPDVEPTVNASVPIFTVEGISNFNLPHPLLKQAPLNETGTVHANTTGSGPNGQFLGSDMRAAYAPGVTLDGKGQAVGLVELGPYNLSDVQAYFNTIAQPLNVPIYNVLLNVDGICAGTPATGGCDDGEEVIDIQQAISMAPNLSALIVYEAYGSGSDALTAFTQAANDNVAKQLSLSFGWGGTPSTEPGYEQIFMELAAQGQNVFVASGDGGASVGGVGYPGNSPNIIDVGGTDLTTASAGGPWQSESGWIGSGGGWNTQSPIPSYQIPVIDSANQGSSSFRNIPDVSLEANTDNYFCANGGCFTGVGGTSLSAPRWAGFLSLANEQANGSPIGFLNPIVYTLGQGSSYNNIFHDITTGDDFNNGSPSMFSAVLGYDLVTGWGTPTGQNLINALAPVTVGSPKFALTASQSKLNLTPGGSGSSTITLASLNGFNSTVNLNVVILGSPTGVTATLSSASISGAGTSVLNISTTSATPGGNFGIVVSGTSGGLTQTAYVQLALPDFIITASPSTLYVNQDSSAASKLTITDLNGFVGKVDLSLSGNLTTGVRASFHPADTSSTSTLKLRASSDALTGASNAVTVSGVSGSITHTAPSFVYAVNAATGSDGFGRPVDLSAAYNLAAFYTDGTTFPKNGGFDGSGSAYSSNLLTASRVLSGVQFNFGPPNVADAVFGAGQTIALPAGHFTTLQLLAAAIDGDQTGQAITVTYADGTTSQFTQSFSDWFTPSGFPSEAEAVAMPYRDRATGVKDNRQFNVYGYTFVLDRDKKVASFTLPNNRSVIVLAATLTRQFLGTPVDLASSFNVSGIYTDGTTFSPNGGLDAGGAAYSANLLGDQTSASNLVFNGSNFNVGVANAPNAVSGQTIPLPSKHFHTLVMLGTGVQGNQTAQTVIVTYTDGTTSQFTQDFSDWFTPQGFAGESRAVQMAYRDFFDGSQDNQTFNLYAYSFHLDDCKTAQSVTLPNNRNVVVLAVTLTGDDDDHHRHHDEDGE